MLLLHFTINVFVLSERLTLGIIAAKLKAQDLASAHSHAKNYMDNEPVEVLRW